MICERHRPNFHGHLVSGLISGANSNDHHPKAFESDGLMISCTFLYPEQFDALRRTYDCEKNMVESLSRCVKWNVSGGKSGSAFLKTQGKYLLIISNVAHPNQLQDDRFIAKELSKPELQTMETFAPAYFDYMSSAIHANVSACLVVFLSLSDSLSISALPYLQKFLVVTS